MVYEAEVSLEDNFKLYYGTCKEESKSRFYNHTKSFRDRDNNKSFQSTFGNWRTNLKITTYAGNNLYMQRTINVQQDVAIYA